MHTRNKAASVRASERVPRELQGERLMAWALTTGLVAYLYALATSLCAVVLAGVWYVGHQEVPDPVNWTICFEAGGGVIGAIFLLIWFSIRRNR